MTETVDESPKEGWSLWQVMASVAAGAVVLMVSWGVFVLCWASRTRPEIPGTFGDAFAPITGLMTAAALGATIASVLMQGKELREALKQYTKQATALDEANRHAERANQLASSAQFLEASRQIVELDRTASALVDSVRPTDPSEDRFKDASSHWVWLKFADASEEERRHDFPQVFEAAEFYALAHRRNVLFKFVRDLGDRPSSAAEQKPRAPTAGDVPENP